MTWRRVRQLGDVAARDLRNAQRFGRRSPRYAQRIWIDARACATATSDFEPSSTGTVHRGEWDRDVHAIEDDWDMRACREHFERGVAWDATDAYEHVMRGIAAQGGRKDGCATLDDVRQRYHRLDALFEEARRERRLRSRAQLPGPYFREWGGVLVHIGAEGQPIFGRHGCHRMAVARILELPTIPAQLGVVHPDGLSRWPEILSPVTPSPH